MWGWITVAALLGTAAGLTIGVTIFEHWTRGKRRR